MTAQAFLDSVKDRHQDVERLLAAQAWLREQADAQQDTPTGRACRDAMLARAADMEPAVRRAYREQELQTKRVQRVIARLPDKDERSVLILRHITMMPPWKAAETMHYSERHLYRIYRRALMHLEALLNGWE
ncbi:MAG: DUF1492 domain-containing protein [Christensenellales bacterium]|jgi:DNA-directed RNA polymerase specialized sigma24 family protein